MENYSSFIFTAITLKKSNGINPKRNHSWEHKDMLQKSIPRNIPTLPIWLQKPLERPFQIPHQITYRQFSVITTVVQSHRAWPSSAELLLAQIYFCSALLYWCWCYWSIPSLLMLQSSNLISMSKQSQKMHFSGSSATTWFSAKAENCPVPISEISRPTYGIRLIG